MKKRTIVALSAAAALAASTALAAEFQPLGGALGMGGAGVARNMGPYAPYWNPAGLAFADKGFAMTLGGGVGVRVSEGLADNVDRLAKFTEGNPSVIDNLENINTSGADPKAVADIVSLLAVINDIRPRRGTISMNADVAAGFQIRRIGLGLFATSEGFAQPLPDLTNVLPTTSSTTTVTRSDIVTLVGSPTTDPNTYFTTSQISAMQSALQAAGFSSGESTNIISALAGQLTSGSATLQSVTPEQIATAVSTIFAPALQSATSGSTTTIDKNQTAAMVKNVLFFELPISYGHPFDLGPNGKLGIGASLKAVRGRVYQTRIRLVENNNSVSSGDIADNFRDNYEESDAITVDVGAQYRYGEWLTVGVVGKNLTSPTFKSPQLKDQYGSFVDANGNVVTVPVRDADVKLKPQVRAGVMIEPASWITLAADLDLTENETVLSTSTIGGEKLDYKSRTLGGGVEFHLSWAKLRAGMYKNLSNDDIGPVATAGFSLGIPWVLLEVDGAYGLKEARYKEKDYPREARANAQLTIQF